jgi:acyl-CoA thioesterase-1
MAPTRTVPVVMTRTRAAFAAAVAVVAVLGLAACTEDASVAAAGDAGPTTSPTARPWDHARGARVVVIGDSISGGHGLSDEQAWPALLARREHWQLTNLSCDGAGVLTEGDDDACGSTYQELVQRAVDLRPAVVFLQASSNDLGQDDDEVDGATEQLVAEVHRLLPRARVIGLSAIWNEDAPPAQLASISGALRSAIEEDGGTSVDIGEPLRGHADWMQSDDVHPTARGQQAVEAAVTTAFARDHVRF